ncbi:MAG: hypothetical protein F6K35_30965 [Okeania sp. SIO2H7]|uniref:hypothetical protein n=1 Tax=Okeania sp. SIO2G5 TaxID=2607796 RepID=UPI0013C16426|nr:hypothetical protein [Okeania sp. SIO2G5]NEP43409.1 hypothetical protein [Okeania sp. SIO2H7]NEP76422.1 hypothetical protein [Okeania sp. SIO2G5]
MNMSLDDLELRKLLGDAEYDRIANDTEAERSVPTVVVDGQYRKGDRNVFLQFENKESVLFLVQQLQSMLEHGHELNVTLSGEVTTFGEYCDSQE